MRGCHSDDGRCVHRVRSSRRKDREELEADGGLIEKAVALLETLFSGPFRQGRWRTEAGKNALQIHALPGDKPRWPGAERISRCKAGDSNYTQSLPSSEETFHQIVRIPGPLSVACKLDVPTLGIFPLWAAGARCQKARGFLQANNRSRFICFVRFDAPKRLESRGSGLKKLPSGPAN